ncbi:PspC domain-containing protein [Corynebacterium frankenforstense]
MNAQTYIPPTAEDTAVYGTDAEPLSSRRLHRSITDRWIGGVCGGIAETYGWDPGLVRLLFVASVLLPGPQVIFYLLAWLIMPQD